jgi:hypothetical protein
MLYTRDGEHGGNDGPAFEVPPTVAPVIHGPSLFRTFQTEFRDGHWRVFNDRVSVTDADGLQAYLRACREDQHEWKAGE